MSPSLTFLLPQCILVNTGAGYTKGTFRRFSNTYTHSWSIGRKNKISTYSPELPILIKKSLQFSTIELKSLFWSYAALSQILIVLLTGCLILEKLFNFSLFFFWSLIKMWVKYLACKFIIRIKYDNICKALGLVSGS